MLLHTRVAKLAAASLVIMGLFAMNTSILAQDEVENLGPVGPYDGIIAGMGSMHVVAFFEPVGGRCSVNAVVWDDLAGDAGESAKRLRVSLDAGGLLHIETVAHGTLNLRCGEDAATLMAVDDESIAASGITARPERNPATSR